MRSGGRERVDMKDGRDGGKKLTENAERESERISQPFSEPGGV